MTGRELIIYILTNGLEDEPIHVDKESLKFLSVDEAAVKFGVGSATVKTWFKLGVIEGFRMGDKIYISPNVESPIKAFTNFGTPIWLKRS